MGVILESISEANAAFIRRQPVFFVATAPLSAQHHVSVSPKAPGTSCVVLDPHTVAYADLTGSGAETAAHILENGRLTLLFCNLQQGPPKILRLYGTAEVIQADALETDLRAQFPTKITQSPGFRAVYKLRVERISTSCGYTLPIMGDVLEERTILDEYVERKGKDGMFDYATQKNSYSIDGLPSIALGRKHAPPNVRPQPVKGYIYGQVVDGHNKNDYRSRGKFLWPFLAGVGLVTAVVFQMQQPLLSYSDRETDQ